MKNIITIVLVIILLVSAQPLTAQFGLKIAPMIGVNYNIGTGSDIQNSGSGFGPVFGAQADLDFSPIIGIVTKLQFYDDRSWSHSQEFTSQGRPGKFNEDLSIAYTVVELLLKISIPHTIVHFIAGPALGFTIENTYNYIETVTGFPSQRSNGTIQNTLTRFEFKLGSGFDIPVSSRIDISPQLSFGFGITNMVQDISVRILSFQLSTGVKFKII
jgi:hypothetical protein